jgi:hypothetical protein
MTGSISGVGNAYLSGAPVVILLFRGFVLFNDSSLIWSIRYIYVSNLQFLLNVIYHNDDQSPSCIDAYMKCLNLEAICQRRTDNISMTNHLLLGG